MARAEAIVRRSLNPRAIADALVVPALAIGVGILIGAVVIVVTGGDPVAAFSALLNGAVGTQNNVVATLLRSVPIAIAGVGIGVALRAGALNLGGEGQMIMGSLASAAAATAVAGVPGPAGIVIALVAGCVAGALWALLPALLEVRLQIPILITSLLLNYIGALFAAWVSSYPLRDLSGSAAVAQTALIPQEMWLPNILAGTRLHLGIVVLVILPLAVAWLVRRTVVGYELRMTGANRLFARYGGIDVDRQVVVAMLTSGAICGLAGAVVVLGLNHRYIDTFVSASGFAWSGFIAAILTAAAPITTVFAGLFLGGLQVGAAGMTRATNIPLQIVDVVQATIILMVAARPAIRAWLARRTRAA
ncbi:MAG: ral nucleoside transport system permease protein [Chloroflexota bacterium]|jgi:simple sugar transport system permease protein|nr:ral nucleoside transport system permease protein [Chloroflexota bacterium]